MIRWLWWHLWVRRQIRTAYEAEGTITAAAWIEAYGYGNGIEACVPMARWLARKHGWRHQ